MIRWADLDGGVRIFSVDWELTADVLCCLSLRNLRMSILRLARGWMVAGRIPSNRVFLLILCVFLFVIWLMLWIGRILNIIGPGPRMLWRLGGGLSLRDRAW